MTLPVYIILLALVTSLRQCVCQQRFNGGRGPAAGQDVILEVHTVDASQLPRYGNQLNNGGRGWAQPQPQPQRGGNWRPPAPYYTRQGVPLYPSAPLPPPPRYAGQRPPQQQPQQTRPLYSEKPQEGVVKGVVYIEEEPEPGQQGPPKQKALLVTQGSDGQLSFSPLPNNSLSSVPGLENLTNQLPNQLANQQPGTQPAPNGSNDATTPGSGSGDSQKRETTSGPAECRPSLTTYNGGKQACRAQLLFQDDFSSSLNSSKWVREVYMPAEPDFEFVVYDDKPENLFLDNAILNIKPTLIEDEFGHDFVMRGTINLDGCTETRQELCSRKATGYHVIPPVRSAKISTRGTFSFRYGVVETRLLVPQGDWIYPAMTLESASQEYGRWYAAGQIRMPGARGNRWLREPGGPKGPRTGLKMLQAGVALGFAPNQDIMPKLWEVTQEAAQGTNWRWKHFRVYRLKWTPDYIEFALDGKPMGKIEAPAGGFASLEDTPANHPWKTGSKMAPFDKEFFLSLAVGVGGVNRFADNSSNGEFDEHPKPWKNSSPKAMLDFWKARDYWLPTWRHPAMEVDYIKVWAL